MPKTEYPINTSVTFRKTDPTPALKAYAKEKIENVLSKYVKAEAEVGVVLSIEKRDHIAEAKVVSKGGRGFDLTAKAITEDLYSAIDKVADTLQAQMRKHKERAVAAKQ
jgi:putative sigma-54 modulation protein